MPTDSVTRSPTLDVNSLMIHVQSDIELLSSLVSLFRDYYPMEMDNIRSAIQVSDGEKLNTAAYQLQGAVGNFCAPNASLLVNQLVAAINEDRIEEADRLVGKLDSEVDRVFDALERICQS